LPHPHKETVTANHANRHYGPDAEGKDKKGKQFTPSGPDLPGKFICQVAALGHETLIGLGRSIARGAMRLPAPAHSEPDI
jgi:hypothetical protein